MDTNTLVVLNEAAVQVGKIVLAKLDENGIDVKSAFWFYFSEVNEWRLLLVIPAVDTQGPREIYSEIQ